MTAPEPMPSPADPFPDLTIVTLGQCAALPRRLAALARALPDIVVAAEIVERHPNGDPRRVRIPDRCL